MSGNKETKPGSGSKTLRGLGNVGSLTSLTSMMNAQGSQVPGVAVDHAEEPKSLFHVQEVAISDILDSDYQTRESVTPERFARLVKSMKEEKPIDFVDAIPVREHPTKKGKWQVARGGHTRLKAAIVAGLTVYPVVIVDYDNKRSALGIARENLARGDEYTPPEEGNLYLLLRRDFGFTQEELAAELEINRDRIKECEAAAQSAPDILEMFERLKEAGAEANHGLRAAKCLRRLDDLDKREKGLAAKIRAPFIDLFVEGNLKTDTLDIATKRIKEADDPENTAAKILRDLLPSPESVEQPAQLPDQAQQKTEEPAQEIQRGEKLTLAIRRFSQFSRLIRDIKPNEDERRMLTNLRAEIDAILDRS